MTRQRGRQRLRRRGAVAAPLKRLAPAPLKTRAPDATSCYSLRSLLPSQRVCWGWLSGACLLPSLGQVSDWVSEGCFSLSRSHLDFPRSPCAWSATWSQQGYGIPRGEAQVGGSLRNGATSERSASLLDARIWTAGGIAGARTPAFASWGSPRAAEKQGGIRHS